MVMTPEDGSMSKSVFCCCQICLRVELSRESRHYFRCALPTKIDASSCFTRALLTLLLLPMAEFDVEVQCTNIGKLE